MLSVTYAQIPAVVENLMNSGKKEVFFVSLFFYFFFILESLCCVSPSLLPLLKKKKRERAGQAHKSLANGLIGREQICQLLSWSVLKGKITVASKICLRLKFEESAHGLA